MTFASIVSEHDQDKALPCLGVKLVEEHDIL